MPLDHPLIVALALALLLVVIALAREIRLRRALQLLLARVLALWRSRAQTPPQSTLPSNPTPDADGPVAPGGRLRR